MKILTLAAHTTLINTTQNPLEPPNFIALLHAAHFKSNFMCHHFHSPKSQKKEKTKTKKKTKKKNKNQKQNFCEKVI